MIRENKLHQIENIMQLGKNEGMFTSERYLNDFLLRQKKLIPPGRVFQPSLEEGEEVVYRSPLMDSAKELPKEPIKGQEKAQERKIAPLEEEEPSIFGQKGKNLKDFIEDRSAVSPVEAAIQLDLRSQTQTVLKTLTPREEKVLKMRFGVGDGSEHTLEEVGQSFTVTRERIRQIESKALRKLRHPSRSKVLRVFLEKAGAP